MKFVKLLSELFPFYYHDLRSFIEFPSSNFLFDGNNANKHVHDQRRAMFYYYFILDQD